MNPTHQEWPNDQFQNSSAIRSSNTKLSTIPAVHPKKIVPDIVQFSTVLPRSAHF